MRQATHYGDSGGNAYVGAQMQRMPGQRMEQKSGTYQGQSDHLNSENEYSYGASKAEGQWRWERDGSSHMYNEGQGTDGPRSYFQGQRSDPRMALEKQENDARSQLREEDMDIGYEDTRLSQSFEGLEQRFLDDIMKLVKEQTDAEDAENARHRERVNKINAQYEEQLASLRVRHANRRDEFLRRESHARQQQYQQAAMDQQYANSGMGPTDAHGYGAVNTPSEEPPRPYNAGHYDSYRERSRFSGGNRDHGFEPRGQYPGGHDYGSGSRYY